MRFLLVEDNVDLGQSVQKRLALDGHAVDWAQGLQDAEDHLGVASYDLILLDIMLATARGRPLSTIGRQFLAQVSESLAAMSVRDG